MFILMILVKWLTITVFLLLYTRLIVKETEKASDDRIIWYGVILALLIYIAGQLDAMFYIHASQLMITLGLKVKTALIGVIYRKVSLINEKNIYCGRTLFRGYIFSWFA